MSADVVMPRLSDSMETGIIGRWLRADGDSVAPGEALVEIETDKTSMELIAEQEGILCVIAAEGAEIAPGGVVARILEPGETSDTEPPLVVRPEISSAGSPTDTNHERQVLRQKTERRPRATPVARKLARQLGIDLAEITRGSGPEGRIQRIDVERAAIGQSVGGVSVREARMTDRRVEPSRTQRLIARRMTESQQQVPHYYLTAEVDASEAVELKRAATGSSRGLRLSIIDVVLYACARALALHPSVNASWVDDGIVLRGSVNLGLAVALEGGELVVPVIRDAGDMTLRELSRKRRELTEQASSHTLQLRDLEDGTFTVSNLGTYGVSEFHAIINPPESGIMAVGAIEDKVVPHAGAVAVRPKMTLSLSADHRVYSGATAAEFMATVRLLIEHPAVNLLEV